MTRYCEKFGKLPFTKHSPGPYSVESLEGSGIGHDTEGKYPALRIETELRGVYYWRPPAGFPPCMQALDAQRLADCANAMRGIASPGVLIRAAKALSSLLESNSLMAQDFEVEAKALHDALQEVTP